MIRIKKSDIHRSVGVASCDRGNTYFREGWVKSVSVNYLKNSVTLKAKVNGQYKSHYLVTITLTQEANEEVSIAGLCDCPVRYQCKHVAAVCFHYLKEHCEEPEVINDVFGYQKKICFDWLDSLAVNTTLNQQFSTVQNKNSKKDIIVYLLKRTEKKGVFTLDFQVTHQKKNETGYVKGQSLMLREFAHPFFSTPSFVQESDAEIGRYLIACEGRAKQLELNGEVGYLALLKLIKTGRLFWDNIQNPPIELSDDRNLDIAWENLSEKGEVKLNVTVSPYAEIILVDPPLYLDKHIHMVGSLNTHLSSDQLTHLLKAPIVPANLQDVVSRKIVRDYSQISLPPIKEIISEQLEQAQLTPHLILYSMGSDKGSLCYGVRLRYQYDEWEISPEPIHKVVTVEDNNRIIYIHRDLSKEATFTEQLFNLGLSPDYRFEQNKKGSDIFLGFMEETGYVENISRWQQLLSEQLPILQNQGWKISVDESFNLEFYEAEENWLVEIEESDNSTDWFELGFDLAVEGVEDKIALLPLVVKLLQEYERNQLPEKLLLEMEEGKFIKIGREKITPILDVLYELFDHIPLSAKGTLKLNTFDVTRLDEIQKDAALVLTWNGGEHLRNMGEKLNNFQGIDPVDPPSGLQTQLRDYQQQGLNWLQFLREYEFAGILADDMGLGKTVQTLAHLLIEKNSGRATLPTLIIAPTSLMGNWRKEVERFTPELTVLVLQGIQRATQFIEIPQHDIILSTYPLLSRDESELMLFKYNYLILDEAQVIKNPKSKAARVVRKIQCQHRLCLTGTPMENHLGELWALFDFLMPGFLREERYFRKQYRIPIEKEADQDKRLRLNKRVTPFMVRRTKQQVASELPLKTEIIRTVELGRNQSALYESIRLSMEKRVRDMIAQKSLARSHITILDALLKLRQTCCHPALLSLQEASRVKESAKFELLMDLVPEMVEEGRKILIFSQFRKMLEIIEKGIIDNNISYAMLTGQTKNREQEIEKFRQGNADIFLVSLKAGGVGLNLTEADTVIHYDPWWNPAAEDQATDRAYRIGQDKPVFVYKLITENTVEEKILAMQHKKKALAQGIYSSEAQGYEAALTTKDLKELFSPL